MPFPKLNLATDSGGAPERPYVNTGTPLDIINGEYIPSIHGTWILSGGAGLTTSFVGGPNTFKSNTEDSAMINCMARFPHSQAFKYDSEYAGVKRKRLANMSSLYLDDPAERDKHLEDVASRLSIYDPTTPEGNSLDSWFDFMKEAREDKVKRWKEYEVETEILDKVTMKPMRMLLPTFYNIDSWTMALIKQVNIKNDEITAETEASKQRTVFMESGLKKALLMSQLPTMCAKAGFNTFLAGHIGKKFSIDGKPQKKDMTYMGQDETFKDMGRTFIFLMSSIFHITKASALVDKADRKLSEYPSPETVGGVEFQELMVTLSRCKNAPSGAQALLVSSQRFGLLNGLSEYHYLRENKYYGLGSSGKVRSPLLGDLNLGRTKIFDLSQQYKVQRALELTYQLCVIQSTWSLVNQPVDYSMSIDDFAAKLNASTYAADDILNSRGWWTYTSAKESLKDAERPYLSLPDILMILDGTYKPKFFAVKA